MLADAVSIQYELNRQMGSPFTDGQKPTPSGHTTCASISTPGVFLMSGMSAAQVLRIDTRDPKFSTRTKTYPAPHAMNINTSMHGCRGQGRVWFAEMTIASACSSTPNGPRASNAN